MKNLTLNILKKCKTWLLIAPLAATLIGCAALDPIASLGIIPGTVTAQDVENSSAEYYTQLMSESKVLPASNAGVKRLRTIGNRLIPFTPEYNPKAANWKWEINLINDPKTLNAWCMAGGKIAFYTGIINQLKLTDDEIAMIMGHEMVHALKEHIYYQINKDAALSFGISQATKGSGVDGDVVAFGKQMLTLTFSRDDEKQADLLGQELAARAGYNPKAAISLWKKFQSATGAQASGLDEFFSTHPVDSTRIQYLEENLPNVTPLYEEARRNRARR